MIIFNFSTVAHRQLEKFDPQTQKRIVKKLQELKKHPSIFSVLEPVRDLEPATHRLRIGEYRLLISKKDKACHILKVGHRRDVYQ